MSISMRPDDPDKEAMKLHIMPDIVGVLEKGLNPADLNMICIYMDPLSYSEKEKQLTIIN